MLGFFQNEAVNVSHVDDITSDDVTSNGVVRRVVGT